MFMSESDRIIVCIGLFVLLEAEVAMVTLPAPITVDLASVNEPSVSEDASIVSLNDRVTRPLFISNEKDSAVGGTKSGTKPEA